MLMLMLDQERTMKKTRNDKGAMVTLNEETCEFILKYVFSCMTSAEYRLALTPKKYSFLEEDRKEGGD